MLDGGTIIAFEIKASKKNEKKKSFEFLNKLKLIDISNNLGDSKTLITHPYTTTHHKLEQKEKMSLRIIKQSLNIM